MTTWEGQRHGSDEDKKVEAPVNYSKLTREAKDLRAEECSYLAAIAYRAGMPGLAVQFIDERTTIVA